MTAIIKEERVRETCKPSAGADCCAYLVMGPQGFECAKLTNMKFVIDLRLADGSMNAMGDNCKGR